MFKGRLDDLGPIRLCDAIMIVARYRTHRH
jgi:hypothetical protein